MTKSRRIRWAGHVVWVRGNVYAWFWWGNLKEEHHLEYSGVDVRVTVKINVKLRLRLPLIPRKPCFLV